MGVGPSALLRLQDTAFHAFNHNPSSSASNLSSFSSFFFVIQSSCSPIPEAFPPVVSVWLVFSATVALLVFTTCCGSLLPTSMIRQHPSAEREIG